MQRLPADHGKKKREDVRATLSGDQQKTFDLLVKETSEWSVYFYGSKFISYVILAELVRSGWSKIER